MAKIRVGFGSDWNIKGNKVGFGTSNPYTSLQVVEDFKTDFNITGVATLTAYGGFVAQNQHVTEPSTIGVATVGVGTFQQYYETEAGFTNLDGDQKFNTLSEDLVIDDGQILNITDTYMVGNTTNGDQDPHTHSSYVCAGSLEQVSVTGHFSVPTGGVNDRQSFVEGTVRFNIELNTLEFYNGTEWRQFTFNGASGRAVFSGGYHGGSGALTHMGYVQISTLGDSMSFGDLSTAQYDHDGHGNETRGIFSAGQGDVDLMQYITITSAGNAINFGDLIQDRGWTTCAGSSTRKLTAGGWLNPASRNEIEYVEMSTLGNALDFGDLSQARYGMAGMNSPVKCVFAGGYKSPGNSQKQDTVNTASKGNAVEFGRMSRHHAYPAAGSSSTRGIIAGGTSNLIQIVGDHIDMLTFASDGEHIDFGNLIESKRLFKGASSNTRMVTFGGSTGVPSPNASLTSTIEYISIPSGGNAQDFGDTTGKDIFDPGTVSDSHGGLGGF